MSESTPWILEDSPPDAPRFELPRLQIIHLMMWMAATAVALLPYRVQQIRLSGMSTVPEAAVDNPVNTAISVGSSILSGAYLFVTAAVLVWRRRGYRGPTLPGHYLAFRGAGLWAPSLTMQAISWGAGGDVAQILFVVVPYTVVNIVFFVWFLRLARRDTIAPAWRRAFGVTVAAPVAAWALTMVWMIMGMGSIQRAMTGMAVIQGAAAALVALVVILAMRADARNNVDQHWSHRVGAMGRIVESGAHCLMYLAMGLFSSWF